MYLETILVLSRKSSYVRAIDVGEYMGYSKPSVSRAMGLLKAGNYITVDDLGGIHLTDAGREVAERIYERHTYLTQFLTGLGVRWRQRTPAASSTSSPANPSTPSRTA